LDYLDLFVCYYEVMPNLYLIGGAPRTGKTTVLQRLIERRPVMGASTDAIRTVAKGILTPEQNPRLFKTQRGAFDSAGNIQSMLESPQQTLAYEIAESEETWKSVLDFISYYIKDGRDAAIEGVAVLPKLVNELAAETKVVFIVNLNDQTNVILEHARENEDDWLHKYDESTIRAFCKFNQTLNQYYAEEANKYGYPIIEMSASASQQFTERADAAVSILLGNSDSQ
jgi:2-phosphoglycerate kinase